MSSGHSSSAYSLLWVMPIGRVITAPTIAACQPQNTNRASLSEISRTWQVRWTTYSEVANSTEPPKAKITPLACSRSEEHTSELQSLMRSSYAVFCLKKKTSSTTHQNIDHQLRPDTTTHHAH